MRFLVRFMLFLMEIILLSGLKPCVVISKAASCGFMSLVTILFQNKWTMKLILSMPFGLRIEKVLIIRSSLGFIIHLFHPMLMNLATLILSKKFGTYLLLGMLDRLVLATSSSHANFIRPLFRRLLLLIFPLSVHLPMFPKAKGIMSDDITIRSLFFSAVSVRTKVILLKLVILVSIFFRTLLL